MDNFLSALYVPLLPRGKALTCMGSLFENMYVNPVCLVSSYFSIVSPHHTFILSLPIHLIDDNFR